ncbi:RhoGAP-domain-containing protein [Tilletiaria anomala UBC 951]|uniref:RhoGAP-domain-containing protein n=1 Tax=Tilletiaria anomala (strain ATCC 24038 / CBS 436.72 / UBC 951) TaxID=1037660 RepID=A0A066WJK7_TILAU|nr:RhoGAP-domain-containing protein [Tilletiaria anomala UBC 951]KDN50825.1 RhoGAP-domain-containing protein [Tilletiaria anomala UBC 951]
MTTTARRASASISENFPGSTYAFDGPRSSNKLESTWPVAEGNWMDNSEEEAGEGDETEDREDPICGGCGEPISTDAADEGVIHFATQFWHKRCFKCANCGNTVTTGRDDILILSDGHPVCAACSYSCQICGLSIVEEAIMTGDESYHAACFTCRSCHNRIEELVFAKTSQGIYCMPCHNQRVARSRRHAESKRAKATRDARDGGARRPDSQDGSVNGHANGPSSLQGSSLEPSGGRPASSSSSAAGQTTGWPSLAHATSDDGTTTSASSHHHAAAVNDTSPFGHSHTSSSSTASPPGQQPGGSGGGASAKQLHSKPVNGSAEASEKPLPTPGSYGLAAAAGGPKSPMAPGRNSPSLASQTQTGLQHQQQRTYQQHVASNPSDSSNGLPRRPVDHSMLTTSSAASTSSQASGTVASHNTSPKSTRVDSRTTDVSDTLYSSISSSISSSQGFHTSLDVRKDSGASSQHGQGQDIAITDSNPTSGAARRKRSLSSAAISRQTVLRRPPNLDTTFQREVEQPPHSAPQVIVQEAESAGSSSTTATPRRSEYSTARVPPDFQANSHEGRFAAEQDLRMLDSPTVETPSAQVKRASYVSKAAMQRASQQLSLSNPGSRHPDSTASPSSDTRHSKRFSFYDPDLISLMDSFSRFNSNDDFQLNQPGFAERRKSPSAARSPKGTLASPRRRRIATDSGDEMFSKIGADDDGAGPGEERGDIGEDPEGPVLSRNSSMSIKDISAKVRESMRYAKDGHVSMDMSFVEVILSDLDDTRKNLRKLQKRYDKMRRASRQAAQGFSLAKEEFEQEVNARYDAEMEMQALKKQIVEQASKLKDMASEQQEQEKLSKKSLEIRSSIRGIQRDLAKLSAERELKASELAELLAAQTEARAPAQAQADRKELPLPAEKTEEALPNITRNLSIRLDGVKEKYRKQIDELVTGRDAMLIEIEELKQSRDALAEETQALTSRNEELSETLTQLTRAIESASRHLERLDKAGAPQARTPNALGFGFKGKPGIYGSPAGSPSTEGFGPSASQTAINETYAEDQLGLPRQQSFPRIEPAPKHNNKFKWMKGSARTTGHTIVAASPMGPPVGMVNSPPVPPKHQPNSSQSGIAVAAPPLARNATNDILIREHVLQPFHIMRPVRCFACQKNMWGQSEMRCALCGQACHSRCVGNLPSSCEHGLGRADEMDGPTVPMFGSDLMEQVAMEGREVPLVVEKCVEAVEHAGMDYEGIYRKSGGTSQLKLITQLFERRQPFDLDDQSRFNDISAVTSVLKNYFRELPVPLLTYELHEQFVEAVQLKSDPVQRDAKMRDLLGQLPRPHYATFKCLMRHLHRVQLRSEENRMNARNLGVVFGPTLMRSGDPSQEFAHMGGKAMTIEYYIEHPELFD